MIERIKKKKRLWSHPTRVRGLKQGLAAGDDLILWVAPYTGAWIETFNRPPFNLLGVVAPYTGAWIETLL